MKLYRILNRCTTVLIVLAPILIKAQTPPTGQIKGSIVDEQKLPIPNASILLKNTADSSIYKTALSNNQGQFNFDNLKAGSYLVDVLMMGYERTRKTGLLITLNHLSTDLGVLMLRISPKLLNGVTIKGQTPLIERQIDKTVVNIDNSITSTGSTVLETMKKLPGVQMSPEGQITLNGKQGVNVYIDGKPSYLSAEDLANMLNTMPASNVQRIEIMTNPSAKYDAAGTAGIINIVKKRTRSEGLNGSMNGSFGKGNYSTYNGSLNLSYKNQHYGMYLNNSYSYSKTLFNRYVNNSVLDDKGTMIRQQVSNNNNIPTNRTYAPSLGIDLYLSPQTTLSLAANLAKRTSNEQTDATMDIFNASKIKTNTENFAYQGNDNPFNYTTSLQLSHQLDTMGRELSIDVDYSNYKYTPQQYNTAVLNDAQGNPVELSRNFRDQNRQLNIYAAKADYVHPLKAHAKLEAGLKSSYIRSVNNTTYYNQAGGQNIIDPLQSNYFLNTENINAAYINFNKQYKKLGIQTGLRAEQTIVKAEVLYTGTSVTQNYLQLFPTVFIDYKFNDKHGFNFKFGRRTERVSYSEMIPFRRPLTPTLYFQGNPNLKPQLSYYGELTYGYHDAIFITFGYAIIQNYVRTLPYLDTNKVTITRIPTNIQQAHSWNIDIAYSKKLTNWWSTDNTASIYRDSFNGQTNNNFSLGNPGIVSFAITAKNSFTLTNSLSAECSFDYRSKRQAINSTFGAYSILSIGIKQMLLNKKASLTLNVNNIFQQEDHNAIDRYENFDQYSYWRFNTRAVRLGFSYRFGSGKAGKMRNTTSDEQNRAGN